MEQQYRTREDDDVEEIVDMPTRAESDTRVDPEETDKLLDEIDALLDETLGRESAEEFVSNYQQLNGE